MSNPENRDGAASPRNDREEEGGATDPIDELMRKYTGTENGDGLENELFTEVLLEVDRILKRRRVSTNHAEDIRQKIGLRLIEFFREIRAAVLSGKAVLEIGRLRAWLSKVVMRDAWKSLRPRGVDRLTLSFDAPGAYPPIAISVPPSTCGDIESALNQGIARLSDMFRAVLIRCALGYTNKEIESELGLKRNQARKFIYKAREALRRGFGGDDF